jgi:ubiquinone/menaquinone biosynthesis C-methylase UbiE/uncharacterized protein YbaR (Trm112 family)
MKTQTIPLLRCPNGCEAELALKATRKEGECILDGELVCPTCSCRYAIEDEIARLLPVSLQQQTAEAQRDAVEVERKRSEMVARDAQVEDYDRMRGLRAFSKIEIPVTIAQVRPGPDDVLLEAGCGTGRMTTTFAPRCRTLVAADFSYESLRVCRRKLIAAGIRNVDLVQADVCALPFRSEAFTKVASCQVLEHIPTPESRASMVAELARVTRPGGVVVLSAYQHSLFTRLFGHKEGLHDGGIYYFRFSRRELHTLLSQQLEVQAMTGALVYHYLARCRKPDAAHL